MDITNALWLFPILFMVHNFEEIIMMQRWWRHNQDIKINSPFVRLATYPIETLVALIAAFFILFAGITAAAIVSNHLIFGIGLAIAFGFQLVGHIVEFLRIRRYMPYILTAVLTLPYYPWLLFKALDSGYSATSIALATVGTGAFGLAILWSAHALSGRISGWLES